MFCNNQNDTIFLIWTYENKYYLLIEEFMFLHKELILKFGINQCELGLQKLKNSQFALLNFNAVTFKNNYVMEWSKNLTLF